MNETAFDLRPLGIGEVLDRAVTLLARRCGPIAALVAVALILNSGAFQAGVMIADAIGPSRAYRMVGLGTTLLIALADLIIWGAVYALLTITESYFGRRRTVRSAFALALRRWWSQAAVSAIYGVGAATVVTPFFLALQAVSDSLRRLPAAAAVVPYTFAAGAWSPRSHSRRSSSRTTLPPSLR